MIEVFGQYDYSSAYCSSLDRRRRSFQFWRGSGTNDRSAGRKDIGTIDHGSDGGKTNS